jgi:hypothetical protein
VRGPHLAWRLGPLDPSRPLHPSRIIPIAIVDLHAPRAAGVRSRAILWSGTSLSFSSSMVRSELFSPSRSQLPPPGSAPSSPRDRAATSHAASTTRVVHPSPISSASTSGAATSTVVQRRRALTPPRVGPPPRLCGPSSRGSSQTSLRSATPTVAVSSTSSCPCHCAARTSKCRLLANFIRGSAAPYSFTGGLLWPQDQRGERPRGTR